MDLTEHGIVTSNIKERTSIFDSGCFHEKY